MRVTLFTLDSKPELFIKNADGNHKIYEGKRVKNKNHLRIFLFNFIIIFMLILMVGMVPAAGIDLDLTFKYGNRQINDPYMKEIYGSGYVFLPAVRVSVFPNFSIEAAYEGGYKKSGLVGLYQDESTLRISGLEVSTIYWYRFSGFKPYVQLGAGYYFYRQDVDNEFVRYQVDHKNIGFILGGGVDIDLYKGLFFSIGAKYVQLEVQPFDVDVDLSGILILAGIGWGVKL